MLALQLLLLLLLLLLAVLALTLLLLLLLLMVLALLLLLLLPLLLLLLLPLVLKATLGHCNTFDAKIKTKGTTYYYKCLFQVWRVLCSGLGAAWSGGDGRGLSSPAEIPTVGRGQGGRRGAGGGRLPKGLLQLINLLPPHGIFFHPYRTDTYG